MYSRIGVLFGCIMAMAACSSSTVEPLGGSWEVVTVNSAIPEAGGHHPFLWRHSKNVHVLVEGDTYGRKYIPDDCVLYVSMDSGHLGAACGDREPLILNPKGQYFEPTHRQGYFDLDPLPINDHEQLSMAEIVRRAQLQPPLTNDWKMPTRTR